MFFGCKSRSPLSQPLPDHHYSRGYWRVMEDGARFTWWSGRGVEFLTFWGLITLGTDNTNCLGKETHSIWTMFCLSIKDIQISYIYINLNISMYKYKMMSPGDVPNPQLPHSSSLSGSMFVFDTCPSKGTCFFLRNHQVPNSNKVHHIIIIRTWPYRMIQFYRIIAVVRLWWSMAQNPQLPPLKKTIHDMQPENQPKPPTMALKNLMFRAVQRLVLLGLHSKIPHGSVEAEP